MPTRFEQTAPASEPLGEADDGDRALRPDDVERAVRERERSHVGHLRGDALPEAELRHPPGEPRDGRRLVVHRHDARLGRPRDIERLHAGAAADVEEAPPPPPPEPGQHPQRPFGARPLARPLPGEGLVELVEVAPEAVRRLPACAPLVPFAAHGAASSPDRRR